MGRQVSVRGIAKIIGAGGVYRALDRARWIAASEAIASETLYAGCPDQPFGSSTFAQFGEDMIIINVFHLLGIERPTYLDVGGHHPFHGSNTALFYKRGSRGVVIEANPSLIEIYRAGRPEDTVVNVGMAAQRDTLAYYRFDDFSGRNTFSKEIADAFVAQYPQFRVRDTLEIEVLTLRDVIDRYCGGKFPDFMSIDVEGLDVEILESFDFSTRPTVICAEFISGADSDAGASITAVLKGQGYVLYARTLGNGIFITADAAARLDLSH